MKSLKGPLTAICLLAILFPLACGRPQGNKFPTINVNGIFIGPIERTTSTSSTPSTSTSTPSTPTSASSSTSSSSTSTSAPSTSTSSSTSTASASTSTPSTSSSTSTSTESSSSSSTSTTASSTTSQEPSTSTSSSSSVTPTTMATSTSSTLAPSTETSSQSSSSSEHPTTISSTSESTKLMKTVSSSTIAASTTLAEVHATSELFNASSSQALTESLVSTSTLGTSTLTQRNVTESPLPISSPAGTSALLEGTPTSSSSIGTTSVAENNVTSIGTTLADIITALSTESLPSTVSSSLGTSVLPDINATLLTTLAEVNSTSTMTSARNTAQTTIKPRLSDFDCSGVNPGYYGNPKVPCDTKFFICVDRSMFAYELPCPARLYYDNETKMCDMWLHVPACSGRSRPPIVVANETQSTLSPEPPVIDCHNLTNGNYPDPESTPPFCSNRFFACNGRREFRFRCPRGTFYDHERNQCGLFDHVFACSGNRFNDSDHTGAPRLTLPPVNFDCRGKASGYYVEKCDSVYYSCSNGLAREHRCPGGLVFDSVWLACEAPHHTLICTGTRRPTTERPSSTLPATVASTTPSAMNCLNRKDGIYRDPAVNCSHFFYYCAHGIPSKNPCSGNLYYDDEFKRCDLWINIYDCSGIRRTTTDKPPSTTTPKIFPTLDFDCSRRENGNYINPKNNCSHFYYMCSNMEAYQQYCPAGLYYSAQFDSCDSWWNIYACSGETPRPTTATLAATEGTTQKPEFDCSLMKDGVYTKAVNGCAHVYYRCSGAVMNKFECPAGLYYDAVTDSCDVYEYVEACSGLTRPPSTPSTSTTPKPSTERPPIDCAMLDDGDYADASATNSCGHHFYTCSSGQAERRECADGTYFDPEVRKCDVYWDIPACTGQPRPSTTTGRPTTSGTPGTPPPFDCTKLSDDNYPDANCTPKYWSCVGGTAHPRQCPMGFIYDAEFDDCEFPEYLPKCGGNRLTVAPTVITEPTTPPGGFVCTFLADGNYIERANDGCNTFYYTCSTGMTSRTDCPDGLFYDIISNACIEHDAVPACDGRFKSNLTTAEPMTSLPSKVSTSTIVGTTPTQGPTMSTSSSMPHTTVISTSEPHETQPSTRVPIVNISTELPTTSVHSLSTSEMIVNFTSELPSTHAATSLSTSEAIQNITESSLAPTTERITPILDITSELPLTSTVLTSPSTSEIIRNITTAIHETTFGLSTVKEVHNVSITSHVTETPILVTTRIMDTTEMIHSTSTVHLNATEEIMSTSTPLANTTEAVHPTSTIFEEVHLNSTILVTSAATEAMESTSTVLVNVTEPAHSPSTVLLNATTEMLSTSEHVTGSVAKLDPAVTTIASEVPLNSTSTSTTTHSSTVTNEINFRR